MTMNVASAISIGERIAENLRRNGVDAFVPPAEEPLVTSRDVEVSVHIEHRSRALKVVEGLVREGHLSPCQGDECSFVFSGFPFKLNLITHDEAQDGQE